MAACAVLLMNLLEPAVAASRKDVVADCGARPNDGYDDAAAIQRCIDEAGSEGAVYFPPGVYRVGQPLSIANNYVTLYGDAPATARLTQYGCGDLITISRGAKIIDHPSIYNLWLMAADETCPRTAVRVVDASNFTLEQVKIWAYHDASESSQGLRSEGREFLIARNVRIQADRPIVLAKNPNHPYLDVDHYHFQDIYSEVLATAQQRWHVEVADGVYVYHLTFDGANAFPKGCGILRWVSGAPDWVSHHVSLQNIRFEQPAAVCQGRQIYIDLTGRPLQSLSVQNVRFNEAVGDALWLRNVNSVTIADSSYHPIVARTFLNVRGDVRMVELRNNYTSCFAGIEAPEMQWRGSQAGGKDCCPPTIDSGVLTLIGRQQPQ